MNNLYATLPPPGSADEDVHVLLAQPGLRIERIVSSGHASPPGFWYDQTQAEWVLLIQGEAGLRFAEEEEIRLLQPGDFVAIAPRRRHRVEWTSQDPVTIWLAIHYEPAAAPAGTDFG